MSDKNIVVQSINAPDGGRCVDVFRRPDGAFGFEECRRDNEDLRGWFVIGFFGDQAFESAAAALATARARVAWLDAAMAAALTIEVDDLRRAEVVALLRAHLDHAALHSPPASVHALDLEALRAPGITFWTLWEGARLLGCGALRELDPGHGEIKSMHTAAAARGRGVARRMVGHIIAEARRRGYRRLSLETGSVAAFAPAHALYAGFGFEPCPPFANYWDDPFSLCMTLELAPESEPA